MPKDRNIKPEELRQFHIKVDRDLLTGDVYGDTSNLSLLMLHGGGNANRKRFRPLRKNLWLNGIPSSAFDFIGCGESTGNRGDSTLESHTEQACRVVEQLNMQRPLSVMGASMGAYTAVRLLADFPIANLILFVPAIYSFNAYQIPFNSGFTKVIQEPQSWINSDAWELLRNFSGNLLLMVAEKDDVIPKDIIRRIINCVEHVRSKTVITVENAPHRIMDFLNNDSHENMSRVVKAIVTIMD